MGQKLNPKENELYKRIDEVLHYIWDPIGISDSPEGRDEYYSYIPQVFSMLKNSKTKKEISEYLFNIVKDHMGLNPDKNKTEEVANLLIEWKELIFNKDS